VLALNLTNLVLRELLTVQVSCESLASCYSLNPSSSGVSSTASLYRAGYDDDSCCTAGPAGETGVEETTTQAPDQQDTIADDVLRQPAAPLQDSVDNQLTRQRAGKTAPAVMRVNCLLTTA